MESICLDAKCRIYVRVCYVYDNRYILVKDNGGTEMCEEAMDELMMDGQSPSAYDN